MSELYKRYREIAKEMIINGVRAADPTQAVLNSICLEGDMLKIKGPNSQVLQELDINDYDRILLFGIGKAATSTAAALEQVLTPDDGLLITKIGKEIGEVEVKTVPVRRAYHPEPREENIHYTRQILEMVEALEPDGSTLIFFMISGGGSALFCLPPEGVSIDDMFRLNQLLLRSGADIYEINIIRKHLSLVKGGRFGELCAKRGATLVSLILSDVVGDDMSVIASGPTYKVGSTFADAVRLTRQYQIWPELPVSIRKYLHIGLEDSTMEPPGEVPAGVYNYLIGNNITALEAAEKTAREAGFNAMILTSQNTGEARESAKCLMGVAREIQDTGLPMAAPAALIIGGEMTVTFDQREISGAGGPNREFVLSSALEVMNRKNIVIAAADTDGVDGRGKSGAIIDCQTIKRSRLDAREYLDRHDAEVFFDELGDSLQFTSNTNVNDINVILVGPK